MAYANVIMKVFSSAFLQVMYSIHKIELEFLTARNTPVFAVYPMKIPGPVHCHPLLQCIKGMCSRHSLLRECKFADMRTILVH